MDTTEVLLNGLGEGNLIFCCKGCLENHFKSVSWKNNNNNNPKFPVPHV